MTGKSQPLWIILSPKGKIVGSGKSADHALNCCAWAEDKYLYPDDWKKRGYICKKIMVKV